MKRFSIFCIALCLVAMTFSVQAQLLEETFDDSGSSATFDAVPTGDHSATFGFDYSTLTITAPGTPVDGTTIPEAPNTPTGATATRGLATQVNLTGTATSLSLFTADTFTDNFEVQVDVFYYHDNGSGSTEDAMVGLNHSGLFPIAFRQATSDLTDQTDGYFLKAFGDVDVSGPDYYLLEGVNGIIDDASLPGLSWADGQETDVPGRNFNVDLFNNAVTGYPYGATEPGGAFRWVWQTVKFQYVNSTLYLFINDTLIATYNDPDDTFTSGKVMLGHEDSFSGANTGNYMIFDNLIVEEI
ncbi:hypothetical protein JXA47_12515, partial [Candidatus Sumerlaeota bacterium]|nr:hypothetical protein [Candidatus Sumerlaeota bacterium]